ncbi:MAG TPA: hypothetical protein VGC55_17930 [Dokdonella sp.]
MSRIKTPSEKKSLSLTLDRRNSYRENDKASRKGIPLSKARSHRNERRSVEHELAAVSSLSGEGIEVIEANVRSTARLKKVSAFRKWPDKPLGDVIVDQAIRREKRSARR